MEVKTMGLFFLNPGMRWYITMWEIKQASDWILKVSKHLLACKHQHSHPTSQYSQWSPAAFLGLWQATCVEGLLKAGGIILQQLNSGPVCLQKISSQSMYIEHQLSH